MNRFEMKKENNEKTGEKKKFLTKSRIKYVVIANTKRIILIIWEVDIPPNKPRTESPR